ncbi:MAG: hypothetical protein EBX44_15525, partial [Betaproteobacteria bacterium]|nr:hypothetical protein [Betaproteobacteria bacterium]
AHQTCGQIFRYAVATGRIKSNPAKDFQPSDVLIAAVRKNFARIEAKELGSLMQSIEVYTGSAMTRIAMKLLAMTFVRTSELINGRWEEIDREAKRWNIPAERISAARKDIAEYIVWYNDERPHSSLDDQTPTRVWLDSLMPLKVAA